MFETFQMDSNGTYKANPDTAKKKSGMRSRASQLPQRFSTPLYKDVVDGFFEGKPCYLLWLVVEPTHLKNMLVKMGIFPKVRGENKKYLSCHHLVLIFGGAFHFWNKPLWTKFRGFSSFQALFSMPTLSMILPYLSDANYISQILDNLCSDLKKLDDFLETKQLGDIINFPPKKIKSPSIPLPQTSPKKPPKNSHLTPPKQHPWHWRAGCSRSNTWGFFRKHWRTKKN